MNGPDDDDLDDGDAVVDEELEVGVEEDEDSAADSLPGATGAGMPSLDEDLEGSLVLDPDDFDGDDDDDEEDGEDDEEDDDEESDDEDSSDSDAEAAPKKTKAKRKDDEPEPPGPDVPAPSVKILREAMAWAFEKEDVDAVLLDLFAEHAHMMLEANRKVLLTNLLDPREVAAQHYLDSWRITQMMSLMGKHVVDLGTGGGLPGLPLALSEPHCKVTLTDMRPEKTDFIQTFLDKFKIKNVQVEGVRAELFLETTRVDSVLVRNVSSVRENVRTLRKVRHSLKELVMLKGASWSREVRAGEREAERLGFTLDTVWEHELPDEMGKRAILVYRAPGAL